MHETFAELLKTALLEAGEQLLTSGTLEPSRCEWRPSGHTAEWVALVGFTGSLRATLRFSGSVSAAETLAMNFPVTVGEDRLESLEPMGAVELLAETMGRLLCHAFSEKFGTVHVVPVTVVTGHLRPGTPASELAYLTQRCRVEDAELFIELGFAENLSLEEEGVPGEAARRVRQDLHLARLVQEEVNRLIPQYLAEMVPRMLPDHLRRLRALPRDPEEKALRLAFAPAIQRLARESAREMVHRHLPRVAEAILKEEIQKLRSH
ncbi:MAG: hypothetical protein HQL56_00870 [Magnetococcales bacterium]|nr:hypothetical protein [Magnetococcales bacterium]